MAVLVGSRFNIFSNGFLSTIPRYISTTSKLNIKEIREKRDGSTLIVEGVTVSSPRKDLLVQAEKLSPPLVEETEKEKCYMCKLGLDVKHTDVLILSQFVRSDGCMLPKRITGLCRYQQKKIGTMVSMAQKAGLMINLTPSECKKDPRKRRDYKKFNTYFDEKTIFMKKMPNIWDKYKYTTHAK